MFRPTLIWRFIWATRNVYSMYEVHDRSHKEVRLLHCTYFIRPIPWGHSGSLCHALSLLLLSWTSHARLRYSYSWRATSDTW